VVRPAGTAIPAGTDGGPADLTETLRASVAAAKASRDSGDDTGKEGKEPAKPARRRKQPAGRGTAGRGTTGRGGKASA
jgi:hypothetical protein